MGSQLIHLPAGLRLAWDPIEDIHYIRRAGLTSLTCAGSFDPHASRSKPATRSQCLEQINCIFHVDFANRSPDPPFTRLAPLVRIWRCFAACLRLLIKLHHAPQLRHFKFCGSSRRSHSQRLHYLCYSNTVPQALENRRLGCF